MGLNPTKGNMYEFVSDTFNVIKGECSHNCSYCYMKKWGKQKPARLVEGELKTDLGEGRFIFVGSSIDMFADDIPAIWITKTLLLCNKFPKNKYLFQSKNPKRFIEFENMFPPDTVLGTTIESNKDYPEISDAPSVYERAHYLMLLKPKFDVMITIEPIMDFDSAEDFAKLIGTIGPKWINIGADSQKCNLPEPTKEKIIELRERLEKFTKIVQKNNLKRILKWKT